jgi:hypothetical protein
MKFAVRGMGCLWGVALLLAGLSACGSSSTKCTSNCKTDASGDDAKSNTHDDGASQTGGAGGGDARADSGRDARDPNDAKGSIDGAVACDLSIAAACASTADAGAFTFHCAATFGATTSNAYLCSRPEILSYTCGTEHELIDTDTKTGTTEYIYFFDSAGKLYAISYSTGGASHCIAGPEEFVAPVGCGSADLFSCTADGGAH